MALIVTRRGIVAWIGLVAIPGGSTGRAVAGDLFKHHKATYYAAPAPYAAAPYAAAAPTAYAAPAPPAYGSAPVPYYYAAAPAYYLAPTSHHSTPKHGHHAQGVAVPLQPVGYYAYPASAPYPAYAPVAYQAPAVAAPTASAPMAPAEILPEAQKVLKLTPGMMGKFVEDLRKSYGQPSNDATGLARVSALRKYAQDQYKEFQGDSAELTPDQIEKLDDVVELVIKEESDRVAKSADRFADRATEWPRPYPYAPYAPGYPYGYRPARPIR